MKDQEDVILSICIPSHNRIETVISCIETLLAVKDSRFHIVIADSSQSDEKSRLSDYCKNNRKIKIINNPENVTPMFNWFTAMDRADGVFAFHLNDRDTIVPSELKYFLDFLEQHKNYAGGICKSIGDGSEYCTFSRADEAFMNIPYFSVHPTGVIVNVQKFKHIHDRRSIFTKKYSIAHPHDFILGRLSLEGDMFLYKRKFWELASEEYYKANRSEFHSSCDKDLFFMPDMRKRELKRCIEEIKGFQIDAELRKKKIRQVVKTYAGLSTVGYFYFMESEHETKHYGLKKKEIPFHQKIRMTGRVVKQYKDEFELNRSSYLSLFTWSYKNLLIHELAAHLHFINDQCVRKKLRKLRLLFQNKDMAVLR